MLNLASLQTRQWVLLGAVLVAIALAWLGRMDSFSSTYLADSIKSTGIIYGIARGINALVSVLQSSEISVMLVSVNIGELLDPLNDLIERFSHVLVVALGALVLQKILLEIVAHPGFSVVLTLLGILLLYSSLGSRLSGHRTLVRLFVLALFLRFALVLAVLGGSLVDRWFLEEDIARQTETILQLENQLATTRDALTGDGRSRDAVARAEQQVSQAEQELRRRDIAAIKLDEDIAALAARIDSAAGKLPWYQRWFSESWPASLQSLQQELGELRRARYQLQLERESARGQLNAADEALACAQLRAEGKACSVFEWFENLTPEEGYREALTRVAASMDTYVENIVDLLVGVLLKSVVMPLLLLYGLYRASKWAWTWPA